MPTTLIPPAPARDLTATLARPRQARIVNPNHQTPREKPHSGCEICTTTRRLNWLCDGNLPTKRSEQRAVVQVLLLAGVITARDIAEMEQARLRRAVKRAANTRDSTEHVDC